MAEQSESVHCAREYQLELLESAKKQNIIVCLGTGTGKTFISIKLIEYLAREHDIFSRKFSEGAKRTFFLVNSVPLVFQQAEAIKNHTALEVKGFCGEMGVDFWSKGDWLKHFEENHVLVMTHQIYFDLLQHAKIRLNQANLLVFDECHHATKNHPFKRIMDKFADLGVSNDDHPRVLGLTASVVGKKVKPAQIPHSIKQLEATMRCVCETASDPNVVEKYGAKPNEEFKTYSSSKHSDPVAMYLEQEMHSVLNSLKHFLDDVKIVNEVSGSEEVVEKAVSLTKGATRECMTALDQIGVWAAYEVSCLLVKDLGKKAKRIASGLSPKSRLASLFVEVTITTLRHVGWIYNEFHLANQSEDVIREEYLKPKVKKLLELFRQGNNTICAIVFVERRYAACVISKLINQMARCQPQQYGHLSSNFVTGHGMDDKGLSDTEMKFNEQKKVLQDFRKNGTFNVLVGTSVVEEGVDIPKCNLVAMFDFPKNYRAYVQSRGRGRAKEAIYVLLVERSELDARRDEQKMYQCIDDYLTNLCKNRGQPSDEESSNAVDDDLLEPYYTTIGAKVDMGSSVAMLYRYCSKLPCDRFTTLKPDFTIDDVGTVFQCTLKLPRNCPITGLIEGEKMLGKDDAKKAVALKACKMLHEMGELDDNLLPLETESDSESEDGDETDGHKGKTGTKKRQRNHSVKVCKEMVEELRADDDDNFVYVYVIHMKIKQVFDSTMSKTKKKIWDRKNCRFGLITNNELPHLPSFSLYHDIGEVSINFELCLTLVNIEREQLELINWFHEFIFNDTLQFTGPLTEAGCRVVLLSLRELVQPSCSNKRPYSPEVTGIDYEAMREIKKQVNNCTGKISSATNLEDSVVVAEYRANKANYIVAAVDYNLSPRSLFPEQSKARTYKSYFKIIYNKDIHDDQQPLIKVVHFSRKIDCRSRNKTTSSNSSRYEWERLVPELCTVLKCPGSVHLRACLLPSVLYRLQSFLGVFELRNRIRQEACIGPVLCPSLNGSMVKKSKPSSDEEDTTSYSSDDSEGIPDARGFLSSLNEYLRPLDRSRTVPLMALLKALTCTSSADDFDLERLEMLGDSFLKMAVSIYVYWHENQKDEGRLTRHRSKQICNKKLFNLAVEKGITGYVKYVPLTRETWSPPGYPLVKEQVISDKSIADSVEALIGAHLTTCEYMTTLKFMNWLGLKVLSDDSHLPKSHYADYAKPSFKIPDDENEQRYREVLQQQTIEMASFEKRLNYNFKNKVLLLEAFTHPTFTDQTITGSYQRLEFLGDAILDFLVTQHIYNHCGEKLTPGKLTDLRSALVNNNIFATVAVEYGYQKCIKHYSPELFSNIGAFVTACQDFQEEFPGKVNPDPYVIAVTDEETGTACVEAPKPLGDVFESIAGAVFLDSGLNIKTVWEVYYPMLKKFIDAYSMNVPLNPIREVFQFDENAKFGRAEQNNDGRTVTCELKFTKLELDVPGMGRNKHNAKLSAAHKALKELRRMGKI